LVANAAASRVGMPEDSGSVAFLRPPRPRSNSALVQI